MSIGPCQSNIAQARGFEAIGIAQIIAFTHTSNIARSWIPAPCAAGAKSGQAQRVEFLIAQ